MPRPIEGNPREVRASLHNAYDRYVHGIDVFPRARIVAEADEMSRKTRQIADLLIKAWQVIDTDESFFEGSLIAMTERLTETQLENSRGLVVAKVGVNAVRLAKVELVDRQMTVHHGLFSGADRDRLFQELHLEMADGRHVQYVDGVLVAGHPDGIIVRNTPDGIAGYFDALNSAEPAA